MKSAARPRHHDVVLYVLFGCSKAVVVNHGGNKERKPNAWSLEMAALLLALLKASKRHLLHLSRTRTPRVHTHVHRAMQKAEQHSE